MTLPAEDLWGKRTLDGLERKNFWIVAALSAAAWPLFSNATALNVLGAGMLGVMNLRALRRSVEAFFRGDRKPSRWFAAIPTIRFFLFFNLIVVVFLLLPVQPRAFAAGLSTVVIAALVEAIDQTLRPGQDANGKEE